ncbi:hypothetical protein B0H19DRAFT_1066416 [Mycena capillaripes]|nr:hypothetical protein B0H19DRAFT_1066416 [Mycena capillaripes]
MNFHSECNLASDRPSPPEAADLAWLARPAKALTYWLRDEKREGRLCSGIRVEENHKANWIIRSSSSSLSHQPEEPFVSNTTLDGCDSPSPLAIYFLGNEGYHSTSPNSLTISFKSDERRWFTQSFLALVCGARRHTLPIVLPSLSLTAACGFHRVLGLHIVEMQSSFSAFILA